MYILYSQKCDKSGKISFIRVKFFVFISKKKINTKLFMALFFDISKYHNLFIESEILFKKSYFNFKKTIIFI